MKLPESLAGKIGAGLLVLVVLFVGIKVFAGLLQPSSSSKSLQDSTERVKQKVNEAK